MTSAAQPPKPDTSTVLDVKGLKTYFFLDEGVLKAVDGVDLQVQEGETVGVIGESGCGKSVASLSMLRLVRSPGEIVGGEIVVRDKQGTRVDLLSLPEGSRRLLSLRGGVLSMVFQEPMSSFSPVHTIGSQIVEMVTLHTDLSAKAAEEKVVYLLDLVGISNPIQRFHEYPHQLSGGMRQRAMIAMALSCDPKVIIADEPTTALDVTTQAQILELLDQLQDEFGMAMIYITHNMAVVAEAVDRVYVMYLGRVVEVTTTEALFERPLHPYTLGLLNAVPRLDDRTRRLESIPGTVPVALGLPFRCGFYDRCSARIEGVCDRAVPSLTEHEDGHFVRCFLYGDEREAKDEWSDL